jgi:PAS domain S-box-containing protein
LVAERDTGVRPTGALPAREPVDVAGAELEELRGQLTRALALVEHAPDAIVILDVDLGRFVSVNAAAEQLFGMDRTALLKVGPVQVSPSVQPDGRLSEAAAGEHIAGALAGGRPRFEWVHRRADGRDVPCEVTLLRVPAATQRLVRGSVLEIAERREAEVARRDAAAAEAARRAAEAGAAQLRAMVAGLNAILWECDPQTLRVRFINARAEELLGYPTGQWLTDEGLAQRILHPEDREAALARVRRAVAEDTDFAMSYRVQAADGRWLWLQHLGHVARDEAGRPTALHAVLFDVTEQRRREHAAALLGAAGQALADPGTVEDRLARVSALAVEEFADRAVVWLRGEDDRYRIVAAAPADAAAGWTGVPLLVVPEELRSRVDAARPFVVDEVTEQMRRAATDVAPDELPTDRADGARLVVPLVTSGERVGLLTLSAADRTRRYDDSDLTLAGELGRRMAAMVAAERLAARQQHLHRLTAELAAAGTAAEAGAALTASLHEALGAAVVAVCTLGDDGSLHTVDVHGDSPGWAAGFATIPMSSPAPLADAARTRRPVWLSDRKELLDRYPEVAPFLQAQTEATASLPLTVGSRLVGAVAVVFDRRRAFDAAERAFLLTVAGQVTAALERAALADVRREMADSLQRSLLPSRLPDLERLTVTARYLPAVNGTCAGGDWYDVLALPGGGVAVAVGDVVGNGAAAAAVMGQLRSALASLLLAGFGPASALELLDRFASQVTGAAVTTVACLHFDPDTGRLTYSRAGHPPPLLVDAAGDGARGGAYLDGGLGPALGLLTSGGRPESAITVVPGQTLLLYTDGLVERRGATLEEGLDQLAAAVTARRAEPLAPLLEGVLGEVLDANGANDDIAVVAVRLLPAPLRLELPGVLASLPRLRRAVRLWAAEAGLALDATEDLQLILGEAVGNAIEHGYRDTDVPGPVRVEMEVDDTSGVSVSVADSGAWRTPPADPGFRGRGLQIISALTRDVALDAGPTGTSMRFTFPATTVTPEIPRRRPAGRGADGEPATLVATDAQGRRCLELTGDLDLAGAMAVREDLLAEMVSGTPVTLDLTRLGFVASVGAGLLSEVVQAADDLDVVLPASGPARRLLDLSGLTVLLQRGSGSLS